MLSTSLTFLPPTLRQQAVDDFEAVHRLGPRVIGELYLEAVRRGYDQQQALDALHRYASLPPATAEALGADRWPPPLRPTPKPEHKP
jgi:hypothetical protein